MPTRPPCHRLGSATVGRRWYNTQRGSAASRGYDRTWQRFRAAVLSAHPLCADCQAAGRITAARDLHHVQKLCDRPDLRLDRRNVMPLCKACHDCRTARGE